ncbi:MAG: CsbD family protein [Solirubrobacteraceae bacterium]|nr:CsbD family protein [Solirubrobacteraceae bacterium]
MENTDETKGRIKEAAGTLTGDDELKQEGKVDQGSGKVKDAVDKVTDKAKSLLRH